MVFDPWPLTSCISEQVELIQIGRKASVGRLKNGVSHLKLKVSELTWRAELNLLNDLFIKYFNTLRKKT